MEQEPPAWFMHASLGAWDPEGCLVSVIDDHADAVRAVAALQAAGFADGHIRLILASEMPAFDDALHRRSIPARMFFLLINLSGDAEFEAESREEARRGHPILVVHAPRREQADRARGLPGDHRAHTIRYYGRWIVRGPD